jgi:hypothetical protein
MKRISLKFVSILLGVVLLGDEKGVISLGQAIDCEAAPR